MQSAEIIVIGSGIIGSATAYYLARAGADIILIDRAGPNTSGTASQACAGGVRQQGRAPEEIPLAIYAIHLWAGLEAELETDLHYRQDGMTVMTDNQDLIPVLEKRVAVEQSLGLDVRLIHQKELHERIPGLSSSMISGSYCPTDGHADPLCTIVAFTGAANRLGARVKWQCPVERIITANGNVVGVKTGGGQINCRQVVLAAGYWSRALAATAGLDLPLTPYTLQMMVTARRSNRLDQVLGWLGHGISLKQVPSGAFVIGGGWPGYGEPDTYRTHLLPGSMGKSAKTTIDLYPALAGIPIPGGRLSGQIHPEPGRKAGFPQKWFNGAPRVAELSDRATQAGARIICGASVWGIFSGWHVAVASTDHNFSNAALPVGYNARAVIIATGATQNPLVMDGWTLPGVITAGAAQALINIHHVLPGRNAAVVGLDPLSLSAALLMSEAGANVHGIVLPPVNGLQPEPSSPAAAVKILARFSNYAPSRSLALLGKISGRMSRIAAILYPKSGVTVDGTRLFLRKAALAVEGKNRAEQIVVAGVTADGVIKSDRKEIWAVDVVITSAGLSPLIELVQVSGCPLVHVSDLGGWVPLHNLRLETPLEGLFVSGSVTGVEGSKVAEAQGRLAGLVAGGYLGLTTSTVIKDRLVNYQAAVNAARKNAIAFLPNIERGRDELLRHSKLKWSQLVKSP